MTKSIFAAGAAVLLESALIAGAKPLQLDVFTAGESSYSVTSTLIYGDTEAILIDAQFHTSEAARLADRIARFGRHLNAIFITHPDPDHYVGLAVLHERFPEARMFLTAAALEEFKRSSGRYLARQKTAVPAETPDSLPEPEVLATIELLVDGQAVQILEDFQGDVLKPANSLVWVPSLQAVIAGDVVFNGVHPWLADSNPQTRTAWLHSLDFIRALHPRVVVAGHRRDASSASDVEGIDFMRRYLLEFEAARTMASNADQLVSVMVRRFPTLGQKSFLELAAKAAMTTAGHS